MSRLVEAVAATRPGRAPRPLGLAVQEQHLGGRCIGGAASGGVVTRQNRRGRYRDHKTKVEPEAAHDAEMLFILTRMRALEFSSWPFAFICGSQNRGWLALRPLLRGGILASRRCRCGGNRARPRSDYTIQGDNLQVARVRLQDGQDGLRRSRQDGVQDRQRSLGHAHERLHGGGETDGRALRRTVIRRITVSDDLLPRGRSGRSGGFAGDYPGRIQVFDLPARTLPSGAARAPASFAQPSAAIQRRPGEETVAPASSATRASSWRSSPVRAPCSFMPAAISWSSIWPGAGDPGSITRMHRVAFG